MLSCSCMLNGNGETFISCIACSRIFLEMSVILKLMVSFDKGTASSSFFVQCHKPAQLFPGHTVLPMSLRSYVLFFFGNVVSNLI